MITHAIDIFILKISSISVAAGRNIQEHDILCSTTRNDKKGGKKNTKCAFPFTFDGKTYDGVCTSESVLVVKQIDII